MDRQVQEAVARAFGRGTTVEEVLVDEALGDGEVTRVKQSLRDAGFDDGMVERGVKLWEQHAFIDFEDMCASLAGAWSAYGSGYGPDGRRLAPGVTTASIREAGRRFEEKQAAVREALRR